MARSSGAIVEDIMGFTFTRKVYPPYIHALRDSQCVQHPKNKDVWFVYDIRRGKPLLLNPVFRIRRKGNNYELIDILTKEIVFSATAINAVARFADVNLPPRTGVTNDERSTATDDTNSGTD